jgi:hypothetical protein
MQKVGLPMRSAKLSARTSMPPSLQLWPGSPNSSIRPSGRCVTIRGFPQGHGAPGGARPSTIHVTPSGVHLVREIQTSQGRATMLRYPIHGSAKRVEDTATPRDDPSPSQGDEDCKTGSACLKLRHLAGAGDMEGASICQMAMPRAALPSFRGDHKLSGPPSSLTGNKNLL